MSIAAILPDELIGLPPPWRVTNDFKRNDAVERSPVVREAFDIALQTLDRTLRAVIRLPDPATLPLPDDVGDAYGFAVHEIADQITVFDDLAEAPFTNYLSSLTGRAPDASVVEALAKAWVHSVATGMSRSVLRWLGSHWQAFPRDRRARLVQIASDKWAALPEELAISLLTTLSTVARKDALTLLALVEDQGATSGIRSVAHKYRAWTAERSDPEP